MVRKIRSYLSISISYAPAALILILLSSAFSTGLVYAQLGPNNSTAITTPGPPSTLQQQPNGPSLHLVKITSPIKGQQVPIGKDLAIFGTSVANTTTSDCKVAIIVNGIKPYHDASASTRPGQTDYSKWNFTLTSAYTAIKPGQNKITAKFSCSNNPILMSHNSVNVSGVPASVESSNVGATTYNTNSSTARQVSSALGPPAMTTTSMLLNSTSPNTINSSLVPSGTDSSSTLNDTNALRALTVSLHIEKNTLHLGDTQTINLLVADQESTNAITGALVSGRMISPSGQLQKLEGKTDDHGKASYSWKIPNDYTTGTYKVKIGISAAGYEDYSGSKTFYVTYIHHHHHLFHHHHHFHPSFMIRPHSSNVGTDTNTNTNTNSHTNSNTNTKHHSRYHALRVLFHQ